MTEHRARCQCGQLTVTATADPDVVVACSCQHCQHRTGSPFGVGGYFRKETITVSGETKSWERDADTGRWLKNFFCPVCGTTVYWTLEMRPDHYGVAAGAFEAPLPEPARAVWAQEKHDWVEFPKHWEVFPKMKPGM